MQSNLSEEMVMDDKLDDLCENLSRSTSILDAEISPTIADQFTNTNFTKDDENDHLKL